ncbi:hypothetical protein PG996_012224 [Apiospora saccharicola]|uniref:Clr5 domain-containing protein n=1 Tax=Apiospora saccharicola TaxID=335842 RepID=A0ABR1U4P6_9PEZI
MSSHHNARIPNEKWEAHKKDIMRLVDRNHSLKDIVEALKSSNFIVTKNQLSHRLNKTWRIHKKTPKGKAEPLWRYIDYQIAERRRSGKTSHVILDGILLDPDTTKKETGRYSQRAWSSGIGARPKTPPGRLISVCTPRETVGQTEWPQDLPWLISSVQSLQITSSVWHSSANKSLISKWRDSALLEAIDQLMPCNRSCQSSASFSIPIPESDEHGSIRLVKTMKFGNTKEALQEQLKLVFLQASNKYLFTNYRWSDKDWALFLNLIRLLNVAGLTQRPMKPNEDLTMLAAREYLFQQTFRSLAHPYRRPFDLVSLPPEDDMRCIADFLEWLLRSGQDPNVPGVRQCFSFLQYIKERVGSVWFETQEQGEGLLFHASRRGYLEILDFVLEDNTDINATNQYGGTALHNAVLGRKSPYMTCKYLLGRGAGLNSSCADISASHLACSQVDDIEILKLLYSRGAIVNTSIDPKATSARFMEANRQLPYPGTEQGLVDHLSRISTPLKAAINNKGLDPHELIEFLSQVAPSSTEVTDWMLESANAELLLLALRSGGWRDLQLSDSQGLLENALEAAKSSRYDAGALCAAAFQVCKSGSKPNLVESLLINRLLCDNTTLDISMEMAAVGIALYNDRIDLLDALQKDIPVQHLARLYGLVDAITDPLWWHEPKRLGSIACFAVDSDTCNFEDKVKQYGWDTVCLGMVVDSRDYEKVQVLMNHRLLRQNLTADRDSCQMYPLDYSPLIQSVVAEDAKLVQACLKLGEPVNAICPFSFVDGHTCLIESVAQGNLDIVNLLLEWNADVNQSGRCEEQASWEYTPLQLACAEGHLTIVKRLIDYGADIDAVDGEGKTVLEMAAERGSIDLIQLLLSKGARVVDPEGRNILDSAKLVALEEGHMVAASLLEAHARKYGQYVEREDEDDEVESNDVGGDGDLEGEYVEMEDEDDEVESNDVGAMTTWRANEEHGNDEGYDEFVSSILNFD